MAELLQSYIEPPRMLDGDLCLEFMSFYPGDSDAGLAPGYEFAMLQAQSGEPMGRLALRVGSARLLRYPSHVGYAVETAFRGHHYAARSVQLIMPFAAAHGIPVLWITCKPENAASRRSCELAGLRYADTVTVPRSHRMYGEGYRRLCRFRRPLRDLI